MKRVRQRLLVRGCRWRDWATAIEGADELRLAGHTPDSLLCFVDTSELVEYVLPHSLRAGHYPTRLDLSLTLLFGQREAVFALGPHAREINGIRRSWEENVRIYREELAVRRRQLDEEPERVRRLREELRKVAAAGAGGDSGRLVGVILDNAEWLFDAWRVPFSELPALFDHLRRTLRLASREELGLPEDWRYEPDTQRVDDWFARLDRTRAGRGEPVPNLIDAYALDQLQAIRDAQREGAKIPLLMTHSGKIMEAVREGRRSDPDLLRKNGTSLVQPPQIALVWRLRQEAGDEESQARLTEELERQRERGIRVGEWIDRLVREEELERQGEADGGGRGEVPGARGSTATDSRALGEEVDAELAREIDELERLNHQWDLLQKIRQAVSPAEEMRRRGVVEELVEILSSPENRVGLSAQIDRVLERLDGHLERLEREVANHLAPPDPPGAGLVLETTEADVTAYLQAPPGPLDRPRTKGGPSVPSTAYPSTAFVFADPRVSEQLKALEKARESFGREMAEPRSAVDSRRAVVEFWRGFHRLNDLRDHPEYHLLLSVVYLDNERWFQAYDAAREGLDLVGSEPRGVRRELLLARAVSARNWVLAERVDDVPLCEDYLGRAIDTCLELLEGPFPPAGPDRGPGSGDARALRELAVLFGSSRERVFGAGKSWRSLRPRFDDRRLARWSRELEAEDTLGLFVGFARLAFDGGRHDERLRPFYTNTLLYALTEADLRALDRGQADRHATERSTLAGLLDLPGEDVDPNFADTLMWHFHVLARGTRLPVSERNALRRRARSIASSWPMHRLSVNAYYRRLSSVHRKVVTS